jgi:Coenzyme PQQ synthesis protein D (PqqD)
MTHGKPAHNPSLAWREIDGSVVIISPADSMVHELNSTAGFIWKHTDGERTAGEIARLLAVEFDVPAESALADTLELLAVLEKKQLVMFSPAMEEVRND